MIRREAGISLSPVKRNLVYTRLARCLRTHGLRSFSDYLDLAESSESERQRFVNALTTNHTFFFRERDHFTYLGELAAQRERPLKLWCAASSTGEEPYSILMTLLDAAPERPPIPLLASDVDTEVLRSAAAGIYREDAVRSLSPTMRRRYFERGVGARAGSVRVRREVRELVRFEQINLLEPLTRLDPPYDVVFCRNVLFYFDRPTQRAILERIATVIAPGGLLFTGHSESLLHSADLYRPAARCVYRRL